MALPADFSKIYGSTATGGLTQISGVNYAKGWEFVGANPPTKNDFSYLQNLSDLKSQWLYTNKLQRANPFGDIKSDGTVSQARANLGLGTAATSDVSDYTPAGQAYTKSESNGLFQPKGNYTPTGTAYTKGESDARYVQNMQRGAATSPGKINEYGPGEAPTGCVLTRAWHDSGTSYGVFFTYRPLQIYINGAWRTITG